MENNKFLTYMLGYSMLAMAIGFGYSMAVTPHILKPYKPVIERALELGNTIEDARTKLEYLEATGQINMEDFKEWRNGNAIQKQNILSKYWNK